MRLRLVVLVCSVLAITACENQREKRNLPRVDSRNVDTPKLDSRSDDTVQPDRLDQLSAERDRFASEVQKEVDELSSEIAELRKKTLTATGQARENIQQRLAALEQERKTVEEKLAAMKAAMGEKWKELREDISNSLGKLKKSVKEAF